MIPRYSKPEISKIWSDENKVRLWQETELAVLGARVALGKLSHLIYADIKKIWQDNPVDLTWWKEREKEIII